MDEITQIEQSLKLDNDTPVTLASYLTKLAGWNSFYTSKLAEISLVKPELWLDIQQFSDWSAAKEYRTTERDKPLSDKKTEMTWSTTEQGQEETNLTFTLKRIDILYRSISKRLSAIENDYRMSRSQI